MSRKQEIESAVETGRGIAIRRCQLCPVRFGEKSMCGSTCRFLAELKVQHDASVAKCRAIQEIEDSLSLAFAASEILENYKSLMSSAYARTVKAKRS